MSGVLSGVLCPVQAMCHGTGVVCLPGPAWHKAVGHIRGALPTQENMVPSWESSQACSSHLGHVTLGREMSFYADEIICGSETFSLYLHCSY